MDQLWIALRAVLLAGTLQAAGAVLFLLWMDAHAGVVGQFTRRLAGRAALAGAAAALGLQLLAPLRLAGDASGFSDTTLWRLAWLASDGAARTLQLAGLIWIAVSLRGPQSRGPVLRWRVVPGALCVLLAFALTGHTSAHAARWLLAPLLLLHVTMAAFWVGALLPLRQLCRVAAPVDAARALQRFSALAVIAVPLLGLAGTLLAAVLLPWPPDPANPYVWLLAAKLSLFALLLALAWLNRSVLTARLVNGAMTAVAALRRSIGAEALLIICVMLVTATLTTLYSP